MLWDQVDAVAAYLKANYMDETTSTVLALSALGVAVLLGVSLHYSVNGIRKLWGVHKMKKRARLSKEVCTIIEDNVVCAISRAIELKHITIEDGRVLYSKFATLGFWGLHPRRFSPEPSIEAMQVLKEQLRVKHGKKSTSSITSVSSAVAKMVDGLDEEFAS